MCTVHGEDSNKGLICVGVVPEPKGEMEEGREGNCSDEFRECFTGCFLSWK